MQIVTNRRIAPGVPGAPSAPRRDALAQRARAATGMSLVEATIILMIIFLLTAVLSPTIGDYVEDARQTKGKEDVEAIGTAITRLQRDIGACFKAIPVDGCTADNRIDILRSTGPDVVAADLGSSAVDFAHGDLFVSPINWDDDRANAGNMDTMENQFVSNAPNYDTPDETTPTGYTRSGPQAGLGWRGPYLSPPIGTDPWGKVYLANTAFLSVVSDATDGTAEGNRRGGWSRDTIVISAGPNGTYDTPFGGNANKGTSLVGDDLIYVVRGDTR